MREAHGRPAPGVACLYVSDGRTEYESLEWALGKLYEHIKRERQRRKEAFEAPNSQQRLANPAENATLPGDRLF